MADQYFGKYTGTVVDNRDEKNLGRLKIKIPNMYGDQEVVEAYPAPPFGMYFLPQIGDTVWVEFEGGHSEGVEATLWTSIKARPGDWPSEAKDEQSQKQVFKTASGHLIVFHDGEANRGGGIRIEDGINHYLITFSQQGIHLQDKENKHSVFLNSGGITLQSSADVNISGENINIRGKNITVDATSQLTAIGNPIHLNP
ncbi:MAG: phage baseplate assembly protein V [Leptolyngbyaceae cyanobacterium]